MEIAMGSLGRWQIVVKSGSSNCRGDKNAYVRRVELADRLNMFLGNVLKVDFMQEEKKTLENLLFLF